MEAVDRSAEMEFLARRAALLRSGHWYKGVDEKTAQARLDTCYSCPSCIDSQNLCLECGCDVARKRWVKWWKCPRGKF
jgi:hypothetical protein